MRSEPRTICHAAKVDPSGRWLVAALALLAACPSLPTPPAPPGPPPEGEQVMKYIPNPKGGSGGGGGGGVYVACKPPPLEVFIQAESQVNPNEAGQPMPLEVRVLLLRDRTTFDTLDFETLWQQAQQALDRQLISSASLTVYPGKLRIYPIKSTPEVAYVALVAIFRRPTANGWKYLVDVRQQNRRCSSGDDLHTVIHARVRGNRIGKPN